MPVPDSYRPSDTKPESKHLRAEDFELDTSWVLTITDVNIEEMPGRDDKPARRRLILTFADKAKGLVLNATNQGFLTVRLGQQPNDWIGATITLLVTTTQFGNDTVQAFRIIQAKKSTAPDREPGSDDR